jgi:hypothetical protein
MPMGAPQAHEVLLSLLLGISRLQRGGGRGRLSPVYPVYRHVFRKIGVGNARPAREVLVRIGRASLLP